MVVIRKPAKCPYCGSQVMLPVVYGLPPEDMPEGWEKHIWPGGCCDQGPHWYCQNCERNVSEWEIKDWLPQKRGKPMQITYDKYADAMYIYLSGGRIASQSPVSEQCIVDIDDEGNIAGIEILDACATYGYAITKVRWGRRLRNSTAPEEGGPSDSLDNQTL